MATKQVYIDEGFNEARLRLAQYLDEHSKEDLVIALLYRLNNNEVRNILEVHDEQACSLKSGRRDTN